MTSMISNHIPFERFEYTFPHSMPAFDASFMLAGWLLLAALYLPGIVFAISQRRGQETVSFLVGFYGLIGLGLGTFEALWQTGRLPEYPAPEIETIESLASLALAFLLLLIACRFMRRPILVWTGVGLLIGAGWFYFLSNWEKFPRVILSAGDWTITNDQLGFAWTVLGWLGFLVGTAATLLQAYRTTYQPLLRNRLIYWIPILLLIGLNDGLILAGTPLPGNPLRWLAFTLLAYVALTHNPPYLRRIVQRGLLTLLSLLLIPAFYLIGVSLIRILLRDIPGLDPLLTGLLLSLVLGLVFLPSLSLLRRITEGWLELDSHIAGRILHDYSERISNILDLGRLGEVAVGLIIEHMQVRSGRLFQVDYLQNESGHKVYRLRAILQDDEADIPELTLATENPIAASFLVENQPLLQYDLDLLPAFRSLVDTERRWFRQMQAEVYLPITSKSQWIGMLAFGPKRNGSRFSEQELMTLSALANQTAVALENARLVDHLMQLNTELSQARLELENNNRILERLDQTKSEFISIASHEFRTPLTVIKGYSEMLMENPGLDSNLRKAIQGIHDGALRLHEIMDSMFDIARIDARSLQLQLQPVDLGTILHEVCNTLKSGAVERHIALQLDLPSLPSLQADPESLRKVFQHLIHNAIKFTPDGGKVSINGKMADDSPDTVLEPGVEVVVSDTGVGVDPEFREIIFTKFYQPGELGKHSTSKNRFKGSGIGLGLALAKGIVEAHGGRIWVESPGYDEKGLPGSQFHVVLPLLKAGGDDLPHAGPPIKLAF